MSDSKGNDVVVITVQEGKPIEIFINGDKFSGILFYDNRVVGGPDNIGIRLI